MIRKHNKSLVPYAKELRKEMTKEEKHLWYDFLRTYPERVLRQRVIGNFIVDFYCAKAKLAIELDGSQHYTDEAKEYDEMRTELIDSFGIKVIRILNREVNSNFEGVCKYIDMIIQNRIKNLHG